MGTTEKKDNLYKLKENLEQQRTASLATILANLFTSFSLSGINIAVPMIQKSIGLSAQEVGWVPLSFTLAAAAVIIPVARLSDLWGLKRTLSTGIIIFFMTSLFCALAKDAQFLLLGRVLMGIGGAFIFTSTMSLITAIYPLGGRGKALGYNISAVYLGLSLGPGLSGILIDILGWQSVFWGPAIGLIAPFIALRFLKGEWILASKKSFDFLGATLWMGGIISFFWGLTAIDINFGKVLMIVGVFLGLCFIFWQLKQEKPLLEIRLLKNKTFALANLAAFIAYSSSIGVIFLMSLYFQYVRELSAFKAGMLLMLPPVIQSILTPIVGRMSDKHDPSVMATFGMTIVVVAMILIAFGADEKVSLVYPVISIIIFGIGFTTFITPNTNAIMGAIEQKYIGQASGIIAASRLCGQMFSLSLVTLALSLFVGRLVQIDIEHQASLFLAFKYCFYVFIVFCIIATGASLARTSPRKT